MKISFSTLACPEWKLSEIIEMATNAGYEGIELRFVQGEDSLWKLPVFQGSELKSTKRALDQCGLAISCVDTSCRFHSPDRRERERWIEEGERMADLAAELGAPGIRVFGDQIQPGASRDSTRGWIEDCLRTLADRTCPNGIEIWIETHGDFATSIEAGAILKNTARENCGVVWDPANSFIESEEPPSRSASALGKTIRHVHMKDLQRKGDGQWEPVLPGQGMLPLSEMRTALKMLRYDRFVSFEWEKKWHPSIADAAVALPHFVEWFRATG
jgi:sugar phosphate isomerase/epimerase